MLILDTVMACLIFYMILLHHIITSPQSNKKINSTIIIGMISIIGLLIIKRQINYKSKGKLDIKKILSYNYIR